VSEQSFPKRLIEVDLPIKRISAHARREKSIRHGHISTLHIWWARRPLAACRAVICAALWPDPADTNCPQSFRDEAARLINEFAAKASSDKDLAQHCSQDTWVKWQTLTKTGGINPGNEAHWNVLRFALLDFIADFANWDSSTTTEYLETSRALTQAAHESLGGTPETKPLVVDPFAGGGSIPLEALRIGADAFASDLNPIPVLLNKVILEYIPKYGQLLADEVRKWGDWIKCEAEKELGEFYPSSKGGATPIAYLWARTIQCEGPGCGAEVPLLRSLWLARKGAGSTGLHVSADNKAKRVVLDIIVKTKEGWFLQSDLATRVDSPRFEGTVKRGAATCPCCGFTTPVTSLRRQLKERKGGTADARMIAIRQDNPDGERAYRVPTEVDIAAFHKAAVELRRRAGDWKGLLSLVPNETISLNEIRRLSVPLYGMTQWGDVFTPRQALALTTFIRLVRMAGNEMGNKAPELSRAVKTCLALAVDRLADFNSSLCVLNVVGGRGVVHTFGRQALPMVWDFMETNPFNGVGANWIAGVEALESTIKTENQSTNPGHVECCSAAQHALPSNSADAVITDPPYYDSVPYAYLSDFFYVWLKRSLGDIHPDLLSGDQVPKAQEIVVDRPHELSTSTKNIEFYEQELTKAFSEVRRLLRQNGIGTIVFASKTTASWEAVLTAVIDAGLIITGSWPIDTEREARLAAQGQARLASSVHIVVRPRDNAKGEVKIDEIGDWRDILQELPRRIHEWMPRLADEGVVGADAIFACLGPALEIFSRYNRVEKASGDTVALREYLEHVWAAVAKEALTMVFKGADASGFEEDARLTAMWLWTLSAGQSGNDETEPDENEDGEDESGSTIEAGGYLLEYDAARKIGQGLGAHLESLSSLVEIKGETARLLPVAERTRRLFGNEDGPAENTPRKKKSSQLNLGFEEELAQAEETGTWGGKGGTALGATVLDRVHQSMILFGANRGEALRRFLVDDAAGKDERFWRLAQVLSYLYPKSSDEKRWIDGVLGRKKGLGL
jgi:putative DNA methylase